MNDAVRERQAGSLRKALVSLGATLAFGLAALGFPVQVQDDREQTVEIPERPERVVVLGALYGEILTSLEALDRVVGRAESPDMPEPLAQLPSVGPAFSPSVEAIVGLEPDIVLGGWGDVRTALEGQGIAVLTVGQQGGYIAGIPDILNAIQAVGDALGEPDQASRLIGEIAVRVVRDETVVLERERPRAAFLYMEAPDTPPYAAGRGAIEHELLLRAGGKNVFADVEGFPQVSLEEVLVRDPQVIFTDPTQVDHIMGSAQLAEVEAVREGRVHGVRAAEVTSTRVAEALRRVAMKLHPEAFEGD